ncbi:MAG: hypothetical protein ABI602_04850 [Candidatus Saccharibacteria bacterium]
MKLKDIVKNEECGQGLSVDDSSEVLTINQAYRIGSPAGLAPRASIWLYPLNALEGDYPKSLGGEATTIALRGISIAMESDPTLPISQADLNVAHIAVIAAYHEKFGIVVNNWPS